MKLIKPRTGHSRAEKDTVTKNLHENLHDLLYKERIKLNLRHFSAKSDSKPKSKQFIRNEFSSTTSRPFLNKK